MSNHPHRFSHSTQKRVAAMSGIFRGCGGMAGLVSAPETNHLNNLHRYSSMTMQTERLLWQEKNDHGKIVSTVHHFGVTKRWSTSKFLTEKSLRIQGLTLWRQPHQPHPGTQCSRCGCFLPDLTRFTGNRCGGTDGVTITTLT